MEQKNCPSTHGSGYMMGSFWDGKDIICVCGTRVENPPPTGYRLADKKHWWNKDEWTSTWPSFIYGQRV